jgi:hypothetical protein
MQVCLYPHSGWRPLNVLGFIVFLCWDHILIEGKGWKGWKQESPERGDEEMQKGLKVIQSYSTYKTLVATQPGQGPGCVGLALLLWHHPWSYSHRWLSIGLTFSFDGQIPLQENLTSVCLGSSQFSDAERQKWEWATPVWKEMSLKCRNIPMNNQVSQKGTGWGRMSC